MIKVQKIKINIDYLIEKKLKYKYEIILKLNILIKGAMYMKVFTTENIRNISLLGHRGSGKTTLVESILYVKDYIKRKGDVENGTTVSDFDKEEIRRIFSINTSLIPVEHNDVKLNFLDTPGYFDFVGEVVSALRVSASAVLVLDATAGVEVGTEKAWKLLEERKLPRIIFVNKMDKGYVNYPKLLNELKEKFGKKIAPFCIPIGEKDEFKGFVNVVDMVGRVFDGKECVDTPIPADIDVSEVRNLLFEAIAETDEALMDKYFAGEEFTKEEIVKGLHKGVVNGDIVPVMVGSAQQNIGIHTLLNYLELYMPCPTELFSGQRIGEDPTTQQEKIVKISSENPFSAIVFKTLVDPFIGKISFFKVNSGTIKKETEVFNPKKNKKERIAQILTMQGNKQIELDELCAGDIGATTKLQFTQTGDTLCDKNFPVVFNKIRFPKPNIYSGVLPADKNDDEKLSTAIQRVMEEDPTFVMSRNYETKQLLIGGQGEKHLYIILCKIKNKFGVHAELEDVVVSYRETILGKAEVQGKHKKQSGGAGQFGDVFIRFEHSDKEFEFVDEIKGGVVPKNYIPAVEKGLIEAKEKGVLAGYPVINFKATLYDGSYHPVDSNDLSFKLAAILAFKAGMEKAKPVLLEPVVRMEIRIPEEYMGDVMGDLNKRRGRVLGMDHTETGEQLLLAEVPEAEILKYSIDLRALTQGRGEFEYEFVRYEEVPENISKRIIEERNKDK
ncbi:translation elongation factor G [Fusobacterium nucleatum CTI-6]|uniref:Elongation factor G n=2 Tax=Fusobacterium TaxID=848 RepID=U7TPU0_FUSNU|nr:translation elongation factor G [Fusobacterium nucleatum CTI-6]